jgi:SAM-dependent methyltransferase
MDQFDLVDMQQRARRDVDRLINYVINDPTVKFDDLARRCVTESHEIDRGYERLAGSLESLRKHVTNIINDQHDQYLRRSLDFFVNEIPNETNDYILGRSLSMTDHDRELLTGRILRYTRWQCPGMIIRPGAESWIDHMVPLDPLYVIDLNLALLDPARSRFHENYQRRLRLLAVREYLGREILRDVPSNQLGYALILNFFNYRPLEVIYQYLEEIYHKLRPSGAVLFTFNDCDRAHGVALAERNFMTYTPGRLLLERVRDLGFVVTDHHTGDMDVAWLELQRPGKFRTLRGGQNLARIVAGSK